MARCSCRSVLNWRTIIVLLHYLLSIHHHCQEKVGYYCNAQLLSAYEQAYGSWDIKLTKNVLFSRRIWNIQTLDTSSLSSSTTSTTDASRGKRKKQAKKKKKKKNRGDGDLQLMFPEKQIIKRQQQQQQQTTPNAAAENDENGEALSLSSASDLHNRKNEQATSYTTTSVKSVSCTLTLERNGKFTLCLVDEKDKHEPQSNNKGESNSSSSPSSPISQSTTRTTTTTTPLPNHQSLVGEWYLTPNPYCVTDRQYDTLHLISEPRMRRRKEEGGGSTIEKATVELRCKVWGRYGAGAVREKLGIPHGRVRGRLTHGTILLVKEEQQQQQIIMNSRRSSGKELPTKEVVGTFTGRTIVDFDSSISQTSGAKHGADGLLDDIEEDEDEDDEYFGDNFDEFGVLRPRGT